MIRGYFDESYKDQRVYAIGGYVARDRDWMPLEIADNLAYEIMKEILNNRYDPTRPRRIAMEKMIPRIRRISLMTENELRKLALFGRIDKDFRKTKVRP